MTVPAADRHEQGLGARREVLGREYVDRAIPAADFRVAREVLDERDAGA